MLFFREKISDFIAPKFPVTNAESKREPICSSKLSTADFNAQIASLDSANAFADALIRPKLTRTATACTPDDPMSKHKNAPSVRFILILQARALDHANPKVLFVCLKSYFACSAFLFFSAAMAKFSSGNIIRIPLSKKMSQRLPSTNSILSVR